jgi:uncharacterized protein YkwD
LRKSPAGLRPATLVRGMGSRGRTRAGLGSIEPWLIAVALHAACGPSLSAPAQGGAFAAFYATAPSPGLVQGDAAEPALERALREACAGQQLTPDGRLADLALALAHTSEQGTRPPSAELVGYHAHRLGLVEPTPHLWLGMAGDTAQLLPALREALARAAALEPLTHCGAAALRVPGGALLALALSRRQLELARPVPRALPAGAALELEGTLARGLDRASLAVNAPSGAVTQLALPRGRKLRHTLRLETRGEHTVELLAEGAAGVTVVALFPVAVGVAPARDVPPAVTAAAERDAESVARALEQLIARERARRGLPELALDARLSQVALLHSQDMSANHFVAHTSPSTGDATARVARAGLRPLVLLENIGRRYSAADLHAGLMESPGHRANIVSRDVDRLGLGVVAEQEGERVAFLATEVFARFAAPLDPRRAPRQLADAVTALRKQRKLAAARFDPALSERAQEAAERFAADPNVDQRALLDRATQGLKAPRGVKRALAALVLADEITQAAGSEELLDPQLVALGVGAAALAPASEHALVVVLLLGLQ